MKFKPISFSTEKYTYVYRNGDIRNAEFDCYPTEYNKDRDYVYHMCVTESKDALIKRAMGSESMLACIDDFVNVAVPYYFKLVDGNSYTMIVNKNTHMGTIVANFKKNVLGDYKAGEDFTLHYVSIDCKVLFTKFEPSLLDYLKTFENAESDYCSIEVTVTTEGMNILDALNININKLSRPALKAATEDTAQLMFIPVAETHLLRLAE